MTAADACLRVVAPYYNLILRLIALLFFYKILTTRNCRAYIQPWRLLFVAVLVYIIEQVVAILDIAGAIMVGKLFFPLLEMVIIALFVYTLLLQKAYIEKSATSFTKPPSKHAVGGKKAATGRRGA